MPIAHRSIGFPLRPPPAARSSPGATRGSALPANHGGRRFRAAAFAACEREAPSRVFRPADAAIWPATLATSRRSIVTGRPPAFSRPAGTAIGPAAVAASRYSIVAGRHAGCAPGRRAMAWDAFEPLFPAHHGIEPEFPFSRLDQHQLYIQPPTRVTHRFCPPAGDSRVHHLLALCQNSPDRSFPNGNPAPQSLRLGPWHKNGAGERGVCDGLSGKKIDGLLPEVVSQGAASIHRQRSASRIRTPITPSSLSMSCTLWSAPVPSKVRSTPPIGGYPGGGGYAPFCVPGGLRSRHDAGRSDGIAPNDGNVPAVAN